MQISVENRVKAHISTCYSDADGRGTQFAFATDYADCMKPLKNFAEFLLVKVPRQACVAARGTLRGSD